MSDVKKARIVCMITGIFGILSLTIYVFEVFDFLNSLGNHTYGFWEYFSHVGFGIYTMLLGSCISIALMFIQKPNVQMIIFAIMCVLYSLYFIGNICYLLPILFDGQGFGLKLLFVVSYILFISSIMGYGIVYFLPEKFTKAILKISKTFIIIFIITSVISHIVLSFMTNNVGFFVDVILVQCGIYIWFYPRSLIKRKPKNSSPADRIQSQIAQLDKDFAFGNISREEYQERKNAIIDSVIK